MSNGKVFRIISHRRIWDKVFKSELSKFFKSCLPQNLLCPLLNTLSHLELCQVSVTEVLINAVRFSPEQRKEMVINFSC